jgi:glycosyltransferase involved in cell wall biosynthesis
MPPQPQAPGAIPMVLHAQLTALRARHQVTIVTVAGPDPAEWEAVDQLSAAGYEVFAARRTAPQGWPRVQRAWRWASTWLRGRYPWRTVWFWEPELQRLLDRLLAERSFDVLQVEDNAMGIYRYRAGAPIVFTEHEVRRPRPINWRDWTKPNPVHWAWREDDWRRWLLYQRAIWRRFDRIQTFTARDAEAIGLIAPELADRVRVNPFSIDLPEPLDDRVEDEHALLFVGNFTHAPNVDAALWLGGEIMPRLRQLHPGVRLALVGQYPPSEVQALACEDIVVTGRVPHIEPYMAQVAVVLAPIRIGGGMRMKVLQGMALGKAVVTTPRGAEGLAVNGHGAPLIVAADADSLARETAALLASNETRRRLGQQARAFVTEHYSVPAYARRLEAVYAEVIAPNAPGNSETSLLN